MREFDFSDFEDAEETEDTTEGAEEEAETEIGGEDEFEPVIIDASRLDPEGITTDVTFATLAAEELEKQFARRDAHIKIYTSQFKVVGKLLVPAEGAATRLSDTLNSPGKHFLPITDAEVTSLQTGKVLQSDTFVAINRDDVQIIIPITEPAKPKGKIDFAGESFQEEDV